MSAVTFAPGTLGHEAAAYASRGVKVFPLWWPTGSHDGPHGCACAEGVDCGSPGKHPRLGAGGVNRATNDAEQVEAWWRAWPEANIGLPAGDNGLAIIDVDPGHGGDDTLGTLVAYCERHGVDMMATRTVRTGSGGLHLIYRAPFGGIKTAAKSFGAPGVDTRGRGGYVVAPPSIHVSGNRYELMDGPHGVARWPGVLSQLLDLPRHTSRPAPDGLGPAAPGARGRHGGWAASGLRAECEALRGMTQADSGRNNALNVAAYKVGRKLHLGLDEADAFQALVDAASAWQGHTPREIEATVRSGLAAGKQRPHPGPTTRAGGA